MSILRESLWVRLRDKSCELKLWDAPGPGPATQIGMHLSREPDKDKEPAKMMVSTVSHRKSAPLPDC